MAIKGKIRPIRDHIIVANMDFGMQQTESGILIHSDNGKSSGVKPRWGQVWAIGPDQSEVNVGDWICVEHGRWTRTFELEQEDGSILELRRVDNSAVLMSSEEKPRDVDIRHAIGAGSNVNFNIPGM